jgi:hypothetical protein
MILNLADATTAIIVAAAMIAFVVFVFCFCFFVVIHFFSLMHRYLHLVIMMETNSICGFLGWIPELESSYKFLYMADTSRCFKIASTI